MSTLEDKELPELYRDLRDVDRVLAEREPVLFKQREALVVAIGRKEAALSAIAKASYEDLKPADAVLKCLRLHGNWMSKRAIALELEAGKQPKNKIHGRNLINDSIRDMLEAKNPKIVTRDGKKIERGPGSMDTEIGLAEWRT